MQVLSQEVEDPDENLSFKCVEWANGYCADLEVTDVPSTADPYIGFNAEKETYFYLFTRKNPVDGQKLELDNPESITNSNFDASKPIKVIIHGFMASKDSPVNKNVAAAYLANFDVNVIVVDWSEGSNNLLYNIPVRRTKDVGKVLAKFLDQLLAANTRMWNELTVIGHSLGAHVAGWTGKFVTAGKVGRIVGLDPAGPLFRYKNGDNRLDKSDANIVEVIHTNSRFFGIKTPLGTVDFYPNTGKIQPCGSSSNCDGISHSRAIDLFVESLTDNQFYALKCPDDIMDSDTPMFQTCQGEIALFGGEANLGAKNGIFYFLTREEPSYGRGMIFPRSNDLNVLLTRRKVVGGK